MLRLRPRSNRIAVVMGAALLAATGFAKAQSVTTVMSGLDNPRGLAFGPEGGLYVVEAGRGGDGPAVFARGDLRLYGPSGAVTRLWHGRQERVVTGLPSHIGRDAGEVTGPHDISMLGRGQAYVTIGLGFDPTLRPEMGSVGHQFGRLARVLPNGSWQLEEDFGNYEIEENPDGVALLNSNPYGLLALPGRRVVVETGSNALVEVPADGGGIVTLAVFPPQPNSLFPGFGPPLMEAVPTSVAIGPDGALYVGQLTGFPFPAGTPESSGSDRAEGRPRSILRDSRPSSISLSARMEACMCSSTSPVRSSAVLDPSSASPPTARARPSLLGSTGQPRWSSVPTGPYTSRTTAARWPSARCYASALTCDNGLDRSIDVL